jgi:hypothetical protein
MAKKGISQTDLEQGIIGSAPAAERIAEVMRLFPMVLLREDPRVQAVYLAWLERMPDEAPTDQDAKLRILMGDATQLFALLRDLGLERYRWLPKMLRFEFDRATREMAYSKPFAVEVTLPPDLPWPMAGKRPKRKPGAMGGESYRESRRAN